MSPAPAPARVWLVGEHNPYDDDPRLALYPLPEGAAGARMARALGMRKTEYLRAFERRNLLSTARWSAPAARAAADALLALEAVPDDPLVLLGARVAAAFGVPFRELLFEPAYVRAGSGFHSHHWVLVLPHPSGRSREWNDPVAAARARAGYRALLAAVSAG